MRVLWVLAAVALASCASEQSVQMVGVNGQYGSGSLSMNGTLGDGRFHVTDGKLDCQGTFKSWQNLSINFPVKCANGETGTVMLTRNFEGPLSAQGFMLLNDGSRRELVYGQATGKWKAL